MRGERGDDAGIGRGPEPHRGRSTRPRPRRGDTTGGEGAVLAGYRLVRLLGRGTHAEVHLARPVRPAPAAPGTSANVALKIVPAARRAAAEAEILALHAVSSDHVVRLVDVATLADGGMCLVESLGSRGTAAALIRRRGHLTPGEVVTLIASVLRGTGDLHAAGFAHGALDLTHVLLDHEGRPVLCGLGACRPIDDPWSGRDDGVPGPAGDPVAHDLACIARLVCALREPRDDAGRASAARWDAWLALLDEAVHGESALTAHDLADLLLDVADAAPLAESPSADEVDRPPVDGGLRSGTADVRPDRRTGRGTARRGRRGRSAGDRRPRVRRHRAERAAPAVRTGRRLGEARIVVAHELSRVRRRVWVLGTAAVLAVVAGVVVLPVLDDAARGASTTTPAAVRVDATSSAAPSAGPTTTAPGAASPDDETTAAAAAAAARASEDPDVAAPALLRERARCIRSRDERCLAGVDQPGSAAEDADRALLLAGPDASSDAALHASDGLEPAQRLGDTALVTLRPTSASDPGAGTSSGGADSRPASLLMIRGEAGWRIRDLMDDR